MSVTSEFEGHVLTEWVTDAAEEHLAVRIAVGLIDRSHRGTLRLTGSERVDFLQRLISNDLNPVKEGCGLYATLLMPKGQLISDLTVLKRADHCLVDVPPAAREAIFRKLTMYTLSSDVEVIDVTEEVGTLGLHGPEAATILGSTGAALPADGHLEGVETVVAGVSVLVVRVDYLGEDGFDLYGPVAGLAKVRAALTEAGARLIGWRAGETLRIEAGVPRLGAELDDKVLPPEVPALVHRAMSYTKGCYVGQETVARIKSFGHVNRELRGLVFPGTGFPEAGAELMVDGVNAGVVTSACLPPGKDCAVGLGFVKRKVLESASDVEVAVGGELILVVVSA
jgi:folate-binding protein YgfZ